MEAERKTLLNKINTLECRIAQLEDVGGAREEVGVAGEEAGVARQARPLREEHMLSGSPCLEAVRGGVARPRQVSATPLPTTPVRNNPSRTGRSLNQTTPMRNHIPPAESPLPTTTPRSHTPRQPSSSQNHAPRQPSHSPVTPQSHVPRQSLTLQPSLETSLDISAVLAYLSTLGWVISTPEGKIMTTPLPDSIKESRPHLNGGIVSIRYCRAYPAAVV